MANPAPPVGRAGDAVHALDHLGFAGALFSHDGISHPVYSKGTGAPVLLLHELPGLDASTVRFADRLVAAGFQVVMPLLVGQPLATAALGNALRLCISREFARLRAGVSAPITQWLRALARQVAAQTGARRIGAIGMCLTGAFVIPLILEPGVAAAVVSQPAIPFSLPYALLGVGRGPWMSRCNVSPDDVAAAAGRLQQADQRLLIQRFADDRLCPRERSDALQAGLGGAVERIDYEAPGPGRRWNPPHALLTAEYDRAADAGPGHPTRRALARVIAFLHEGLATPPVA